MTLIAVTGHRPGKLGGYQNHPAVALFAKMTLEQLKSLKPDAMLITGMALGWDQAIAEACIKVDLPYIAAIPFPEQEKLWPFKAQEHYHELLDKSTGIEIVDKHPLDYRWSMHLRNMWMVDNSEALLALWDGSSGGTGNCINYAKKVQRPWVNMWDGWEDFNEAIQLKLLLGEEVGGSLR